MKRVLDPPISCTGRSFARTLLSNGVFTCQTISEINDKKHVLHVSNHYCVHNAILLILLKVDLYGFCRLL